MDTKVYIVVYTWDFEYSQNVLVTLDKEKAEKYAKEKNEALDTQGKSDVYHYGVDIMTMDEAIH